MKYVLYNLNSAYLTKKRSKIMNTIRDGIFGTHIYEN